MLFLFFFNRQLSYNSGTKRKVVWNLDMLDNEVVIDERKLSTTKTSITLAYCVQLTTTTSIFTCKRCGISLPRRFPSMRTGRMRLQRVKQVIARCSMRVWLVPIQVLFKLNCRYILWLILRRIVIHMWFALYNCFFGLWRVYLSSLIDMCVFTCAPSMISYYSVGSIVLQKQFLQFFGSKVALNQYFSIHVQMQF